MNYKSIIMIALIAINFSMYSQGKVGINTDEPTEALHVYGDENIKGNLRVRKIKKIGSSRSLVADNDGVLGYYADFALYNIESHVATDPVDIIANEKEEVLTYNDGEKAISKDKSLGLETTFTIPANTEAKVIIEYSVPLGIVVDKNEKNLTKNFYDYAGVRFMREQNGVKEERPGGSRKYTVDNWIDIKYGTVVTVINKYVEEFEAKPKERKFIYSLNAYVEHWASVKRHYRFNMYSSTPGENRNWGKGIITQKVYYR